MPCLGVSGGGISEHFSLIPILHSTMSIRLCCWTRVLEHVQKANVHITHVDLTAIAQIPKVGPHREMIRRNVARLLGLDMGAVNVKATTEEGLGFTGERLGIKAVAVVTGLRGNRDA